MTATTTPHQETLTARLGRVGLGCAQLGDLFTPITDADAVAIVDAAWTSGIRYFDTAPHYGLGLSERRLGLALADRDRDTYTISTKVGRLLRQGEDGQLGRRWDFSRDGILRSLEESLRRLGTERIDIALLHDPHESGQLDLAAGEGAETLSELREQGVIGAFGVGSADVTSLTRFARQTELDVILLAGRHTLLDQSADASLLPACADHGIRVLNAGVYNTGVLAKDDPDASSRFEYSLASPAVIERARRIADLCRRHGVRLPAAAIQFSFTSPSVSTVVVGADTPAQVHETIELADTRIPDALWQDLRTDELISS